MKKIILLLACGLFSTAIFAQEQQDFNRWSIELQAGVHHTSKAFSDGYRMANPALFQGGLGVRYMLSDRFGLKLDFNYNSFKEADDTPAFEAKYMRFSLQGVANAGDILNFQSWTNSIGLLVHAGGGYGLLDPENRGPNTGDGSDEMYHLMFGFTPQLKLSNRIALTGDLTFVGNFLQNITYDGQNRSKIEGLDGILVNGSLGLTFYLGSAEEHADWYSGAAGSNEKLDSLAQRLTKVENDMVDSDQDGVPNYLDKEPNTVNGVAVDSKGVAVDKNNNGIPDELESSLDERYSTTSTTNMTGGAMIADLLNDGYVNVYFQFDSTDPETYSLNAINYCITYMRNNPDAQAELIGYADEIGNSDYNNQLSEARAQTVYDIMVASGIDASRLSVTGNGEDASVDKGSQQARQLVRRVTFKLK